MKQLNIFKKRVNYKPFEYPEVMTFIDNINRTFWVHNEIDFTADIQDFSSSLTLEEKEVVKRSLLSIAQIEVGVKTFWGNLYSHLPKPEFNGLGSTFSECEFRHSEAYSRLLEVLGYNDEFEKLLEIPIFKDKLQMIEENLSSDDIIEKLIFFAIVIENSSLFSQFANILSFTRFKGLMKNISNIIAWTSVDEQIHAKAGIFIINKVVEEGYDINRIKVSIEAKVRNYMQFEERLLDWIFEKGELSFFTKEDLLNFMKDRIDTSLKELSLAPIFNVSKEDCRKMYWFDEEIQANTLDDFFAKRPVEYTKHDKSITSKDLF